jgi:hypothetical protein
MARSPLVPAAHSQGTVLTNLMVLFSQSHGKKPCFLECFLEPVEEFPVKELNLLD